MKNHLPEGGGPVIYDLSLGEESIRMNDHLGKPLALKFLGKISCLHCERTIKKSFGQGFCFNCFQSLAQCDQCIMKPELCHYHQGTCREPAWGERHCLIEHTVYLANSSALKVGITRRHQQLTRWIDQGASQALAIRIVTSRLEAGHCEVALKQFVSDRTQWQTMLKGVPETLDLEAERDSLLKQCPSDLPGEAAFESVYQIEYPVLEYPQKVKSHNLDKNHVLEGQLMGIKGQYLIFDKAVINVRKYQGYHLALDISS